MTTRNKSQDSFQIVYKAMSKDGECLYVGSGATGRERHLTSGKSHCREANEWFYKDKKIIIEVIDNCESTRHARNSEARFIEKLNPLWNKAQIKERANRLSVDSIFIGLVLIILEKHIKNQEDFDLVGGLMGFFKSSTNNKMDAGWYELRSKATLFLRFYNNVNFMNKKEKDYLLMGVVKRILLEKSEEDVVSNILKRAIDESQCDNSIAILDMLDCEELLRFNILIDQLSRVPSDDEWYQLLHSKVMSEIQPYLA